MLVIYKFVNQHLSYNYIYQLLAIIITFLEDFIYFHHIIVSFHNWLKGIYDHIFSGLVCPCCIAYMLETIKNILSIKIDVKQLS